jgi:serine/threonine protein kinase
VLTTTECLGDWFPQNTSYPTRSGDVWSLGVILVNLVCGRNPWRIASPTDESFNSFLADPRFLRKILPVSEDCLYILTQIFTLDPSQRIDLASLRELILQVECFDMGEEELRSTHRAAQPVQPVLPPKHHVVVPDSIEDWGEDTVFVFDDHETPALSNDSGSSSPPHRGRNASSDNGSLPPTPLLGADCSTRLPDVANPWDLLKYTIHSGQTHPAPTSADCLVESRNPYFLR